MTDAAWKAAERAICRKFGGERSGPTGKDGPDCRDTCPFAVQIKHGTKFPKWLIEDMAQTVRDAPFNSLPVLVLHPKGAKYDDSLVVMRLGDFSEWYLE